MSGAILHHRAVGDTGAKWLYILHGIYGAGRNWATFARGLVDERDDWGAVLVDLRLHGESQGFSPPHTLAACVHDLAELVQATDRPASAVLGHSFGGKIALMAPPVLGPRQVWVIDSTPSRRTPGGSANRMLGILRRHPGPFETREDAVEALQGEGLAAHVARWMATNLVSDEESYRWRFDLDGLAALLDDFFRRDLWDVIEDPPGETEIHLVRASESDVIPRAELRRIESLGTERPVLGHEVHGGHWLHIDNPGDLRELLDRRLP